MSKPEFIEAHDRTGWPDEPMVRAESCIAAIARELVSDWPFWLLMSAIAVLLAFAIS